MKKSGKISRDGRLEFFVPEHIASYIREREGKVKIPDATHFTSVAMFVDVSGFTTLTEKLADNKEGGVELLGFFLNRYFERLVKRLNASGGDVIKFAGDAMIVLWQPEKDPVTEETNLKLMASRAAQCALQIQEELHGAELAKDVTFSVKVGISCEVVSMLHLGGVCGRVEYTPCGQALLESFECESYCRPGHTVVTMEVWNFIKDDFDGLEIPNFNAKAGSSIRRVVRKTSDQSISATSNDSMKQREGPFKGSFTRKTKGADIPSAPYSARSQSVLLENKRSIGLGRRGSAASMISDISVDDSEEKNSSEFVRLLRLRKRIKKSSVKKTLLETQEELKALSLYVPAAVKPFLQQDQSSWSSELRPATVCFLNLNLEVLKLLSGKKNELEGQGDGYEQVLKSDDGQGKKIVFDPVIGAGNETCYENRLLTVMHSLQETFLLIQKYVYEYEGSINKFLVDDKGSTILIVWGLPPLTHIDDCLRAVVFGLVVSEELKALRLTQKVNAVYDPESNLIDFNLLSETLGFSPFSAEEEDALLSLVSTSGKWISAEVVKFVKEQVVLQRLRLEVCSIGLTSGEILIGPVGSGTRREYSVLGDVVNTSARLMQTAKTAELTQNEFFHGNMLCSLSVYDSVRHSVGFERIQFEVLKPIRLKGKVGLVEIFQPGVSATDKFEKGIELGKIVEEKPSDSLTARLFTSVSTQNLQGVRQASSICRHSPVRLDLELLYYFDCFRYACGRDKMASDQRCDYSVIIVPGLHSEAKKFFLNSFVDFLRKEYAAVCMHLPWEQKKDLTWMQNLGAVERGRTAVFSATASVEMFKRRSYAFAWKLIIHQALKLVRTMLGPQFGANQFSGSLLTYSEDISDEEMIIEAKRCAKKIINLLWILTAKGEILTLVFLNSEYFSRADWLLTGYVCETMGDTVEDSELAAKLSSDSELTGNVVERIRKRLGALILDAPASETRRLRNCFVVFSSFAMYNSSEKHLFEPVCPEFIQILHSPYSGLLLSPKMGPAEVDSFLKSFLAVASVSSEAVYLILKLTDGDVYKIIPVVDSLFYAKDIVVLEEKLEVRRMVFNVNGGGFWKPALVTPTVLQSSFGMVIDKLSKGASLLLKCLAVLCFGTDTMDTVQVVFLRLVHPHPLNLETRLNDGKGKYGMLRKLLKELRYFGLIKTYEFDVSRFSKTDTDILFRSDYFRDGDILSDHPLLTTFVAFECVYLKHIVYRRLLLTQRRKLHKKFYENIKACGLSDGVGSKVEKMIDALVEGHRYASQDKEGAGEETHELMDNTAMSPRSALASKRKLAIRSLQPEMKNLKAACDPTSWTLGQEESKPNIMRSRRNSIRSFTVANGSVKWPSKPKQKVKLEDVLFNCIADTTEIGKDQLGKKLMPPRKVSVRAQSLHQLGLGKSKSELASSKDIAKVLFEREKEGVSKLERQKTEKQQNFGNKYCCWDSMFSQLWKPRVKISRVSPVAADVRRKSSGFKKRRSSKLGTRRDSVLKTISKKETDRFQLAKKKTNLFERHLLRFSKPIFKLRIKSLVSRLDDWDFSIFEFERFSMGFPLLSLSMMLFAKFSICEKLGLSSETLANMAKAVDLGYPSNPYHNSLHAADVLLSAQVFADRIVRPQKEVPTIPKYENGVDLNQEMISCFDVFNLFLACMIHDFQHPGVSAPFLAKTNDILTQKYSKPHLENFHYAKAMELIQSTDGSKNIFIGMDLPLVSQSKETICKLVLATSLTEHYTFLDSFKNRKTSGIGLERQCDRQLVLELLIKCADVSNPAKNIRIYKTWVSRIIDEFHTQGDYEKALELPVSDFMDRNNKETAKCQVGFIKFIVEPIFSTLASYRPDIGEIFEGHLSSNLEFWENPLGIQAAGVDADKETPLESEDDKNETNGHIEYEKASSFSSELSLFSVKRDPVVAFSGDGALSPKHSMRRSRLATEGRSSSLGELIDVNIEASIPLSEHPKQRRVSLSFY